MLFRYAKVELAPRFNVTGTCAEVEESPAEAAPSRIVLHCPMSASGAQVIDKVIFASFGTPTGGCDTHGGGQFQVDKSCHAANSSRVVSDVCAGSSTCTIEATDHEFGDPCHGKVKRLAALVSCKSPGGGGDAARKPPPVTIDLAAWVVRYPWNEADSDFSSSDATLNAVWRLSRNTLRETSLDTATDSNTRERLPYEADGYITGLSRLALQAEYAWPRHSWSHSIYNPTWPTEWRQTTPLMAHADFLATGELTLYRRFADVLVPQTQVGCLNSTTGLVDFRTCRRQTAGLGAGSEAGLRDIVDWPPASRDGYVLTDAANTVVNAYAAVGLRALAHLANASGNVSASAALRRSADSIKCAINTLLWDPALGRFRDGLDETGRPIDHTAWHASVFVAAFGLVPPERWPSVLAFFRQKGMAGSVYASFYFLLALYQAPDHGQLALEMLTSCAKNSWCNMIAQGATATMEAWTTDEKPNLSWSHPWASAPASAVVWGLFGITAIAPGWERFEVRPRPGNLSWASIRVPSRHGPIDAALNQTTTQFSLTLHVPDATEATVCVPRLGLGSIVVHVDGTPTNGRLDGDFVCVDAIGPRAGGSHISRSA